MLGLAANLCAFVTACLDDSIVGEFGVGRGKEEGVEVLDLLHFFEGEINPCAALSVQETFMLTAIIDEHASFHFFGTPLNLPSFLLIGKTQGLLEGVRKNDGGNFVLAATSAVLVAIVVGWRIIRRTAKYTAQGGNSMAGLHRRTYFREGFQRMIRECFRQRDSQ